MRKRNQGLGLQILRGVGIGVGFAVVSVLSPTFPYAVLRTYLKKKFGKTYSPSQLINSVNYLKRKKFISYTNGKYTITKVGQERLNEAAASELSITKVPWDGKWRFVSFDVPEEMKPARRSLMLHLKSLGFYHFQRSLFVIPYPCDNEIAELASILEITPFVFVFLANRFPADRRLKKFFNL